MALVGICTGHSSVNRKKGTKQSTTDQTPNITAGCKARLGFLEGLLKFETERLATYFGISTIRCLRRHPSTQTNKIQSNIILPSTQPL